MADNFYITFTSIRLFLTIKLQYKNKRHLESNIVTVKFILNIIYLTEYLYILEIQYVPFFKINCKLVYTFSGKLTFFDRFIFILFDRISHYNSQPIFITNTSKPTQVIQLSKTKKKNLKPTTSHQVKDIPTVLLDNISGE